MNNPDPKPRRRQSRHRVRLDPMLESEKTPKTFIREYDPARSAEEFLDSHLKPYEEDQKQTDQQSDSLPTIGEALPEMAR